MKKILLLLFILPLFSACSKDDEYKEEFTIYGWWDSMPDDKGNYSTLVFDYSNNCRMIYYTSGDFTNLSKWIYTFNAKERRLQVDGVGETFVKDDDIIKLNNIIYNRRVIN